MDRIPPQNIEAEMAVLGAMLLGDRGAVERATEILQREDFYREAHAHIFDVMVHLSERDEPVDFVTVKNDLDRRSILDGVGGIGYLMQLGDFVATTANVAYHASIVREKALLRRLIEAASHIAGMAYGEVDEVETIVDMAERTVFEVASKRSTQSFAQLRPLLNEAFEKIDTLYHEKGVVTGIETGFKDLNYITSGLQPGDLFILAARPSMGKCLTASSRIDHPLTGERLTIEQYVRQQVPVVANVGACGGMQTARISHWVDSGVKPCWRVTTRTGRSVEVTGHHPFLTVHGWTPLHDLAVGDRIGVPRVLPVFGSDDSLPLDLVRLMAYFIAEGGLTHNCPTFTNTDPAIIADFRDIASRHYPECVVRQTRITYKVVRPTRSEWTSGPNPVTEWLRGLGLWGKLSEAKSFPDCVWTWPKRHLAEFLRVLLSCDGTIYAMSGYPRIEFAVASEQLARDVHHALVRFGVVAKLWRKKDRCWRVEVTDPESVASYQREIGWIGEKANRRFRPAEERARARSNSGHLPREVWALVRAAAGRKRMSLTELARLGGERFTGGYNPHTNRGLPRRRLAAYAEALDDDRLRFLASPELYWDEIVAIESIGEHQVYDLTVPDGANFIAEAVCVHNTSLAMGIGQNAALQAAKTVAVFSMEMSKEQLVQRMMCSEARVDAHRLRTGYLQDDDWTRLADSVQRLWDANVLIDDTTDMSALEMRAKCRRLRAEHGGLDLVIVDYLQLMRGSSKNSENRNQEITEIARGLKGLAREMRVPVIALSQLSRAVERREDKRPMLSDLRECVTGDTGLICANTGKRVRIADVRPGDRVLAVGTDQKVLSAVVSHLWRKGRKPVFRVTTETGRVIECTDNHPFLTQDGYKPLAELGADDLVATPLRLPTHGTEKPGRADLCRFLGYLVGDGHYGKHRTVSFISADQEVYADAKDIAARHFPGVFFNESTTCFKQTCWEVDFVFHHKEGRYGKPGGNPLIHWLRSEVDVLGQLCHDKRVPDWVFEAGAIGAVNFLAGYLATDGCVKRRKSDGRYDVHFDTVSHGLALDVQHLLARLGVVATVENAQRKDGIHRPIYRVAVNPMDANLRQFAEAVKPVGRKGKMLAAFLAEQPKGSTNPGVFCLPGSISRLMAERTQHLRQQGRKLPERAQGRLYWKDQRKRPRRDTCYLWAEKLGDEELRVWAESDLLWERVRSVEPAGEQETFDICVPETGNFIADGIVVHNSGAIEAEADVVAFIYRPAYYERKQSVSQDEEAQKEENRRPGEYETEEAEVIIAKQRNGPTGTVKLAFMPKFARFDNLAEYREDNPF